MVIIDIEMLKTLSDFEERETVQCQFNINGDIKLLKYPREFLYRIYAVESIKYKKNAKNINNIPTYNRLSGFVKTSNIFLRNVVSPK